MQADWKLIDENTPPKDGSLFFAWREHTPFPLMAKYNELYDEYEDYFGGHFIHSITHWDYLPEGPK